MTDLAPYAPPAAPAAAVLVEWAAAAGAAHDLAQTLVRTQICPEPFRGKPGEATSVILLGAELGLSPIASLRSMFVIRGQVGMYVSAQLALALQRGHRIWTEAESDTSVTVAGHRAGDPDHVERSTWTIERARLAGFIRRGRDNAPSQYETQPRTMLWARAAGTVARRIAPDALQGVPELDDLPEPPAAAPRPAGRIVERYKGALPMPIAQAVEEVVGTPAPVAPEMTEAQAEEAAPEIPPERTPARSRVAEPAVKPPAEGPIREAPVLDIELPQPEPEPARMTEAQRARIMAELNGRGIRGHEARTAWISNFLGRQLESSNELTPAEASSVIDRLEWEGSVDES